MFFTTLDHLFMLQHVVYCLKINEYYDSRSVIMRIVYSGILRVLNSLVSISFCKLIFKSDNNSQGVWQKSFHDVTPNYNTILTIKHMKKYHRFPTNVSISMLPKGKKNVIT